MKVPEYPLSVQCSNSLRQALPPRPSLALRFARAEALQTAAPAAEAAPETSERPED
jgi:hypothetical protein